MPPPPPIAVVGADDDDEVGGIEVGVPAEDGVVMVELRPRGLRALSARLRGELAEF